MLSVETSSGSEGEDEDGFRNCRMYNQSSKANENCTLNGFLYHVVLFYEKIASEI